MRILSALAIASATLLAMSFPAHALTFKSGESKSFGKDSGEIESKVRGKNNPNWHPSIKTELHNIDITGATFQYVDDVFAHALSVFQLNKIPKGGLNVIGQSIDPNMEVPDVDCEKYLKNIESDYPKRWDDPVQLQRCNYFYRANFFNGTKETLQAVLDHWAAKGPEYYKINYNSEEPIYGKQVTVAQISTHYALFYDHFKNREAIDNFLTNWSLQNQSNVRSGIPTCPFSKPSNFAKNYEKGRYDRDACGSNVWRGSVAKIALGLRLQNRDLFIAGVQQLEINLSMYDEDGIFVPYANRGWDSPGYAVDNDEYINAIAIMLEDLNVDLYQVRIKGKATVAELMRGHREWLNDPKKAQHYMLGTLTGNGGVSVRFNDLNQAGSLNQWKQDKQFTEIDLSLRAFHYLANQHEKINSDPIALINQLSGWLHHGPMKDGELPVMYAWGQTSGFPFILATLNKKKILKNYLNQIGEPFLGELNDKVLLKDKEPLKGAFVCTLKIQRFLQNDSSLAGSSKIHIEDGRIQFLETRWRTGGSEADTDILNSMARLIIDENRVLTGYMPVYTMFEESFKKTLVLGEAFLPKQNTFFPEGVARVKLTNRLEFDVEINDCDNSVKTNEPHIVPSKPVAETPKEVKLNDIKPDQADLLEGQFVCSFKIRRTLKPENNVGFIFEAKVNINSGILSFTRSKWRTGSSSATQDATDEASLLIKANGELIGEMPVFFLFGNDEKVDVSLPGEFESSNTPFILEGKNSVVVRDGLELDFFIENCVN